MRSPKRRRRKKNREKKQRNTKKLVVVRRSSEKKACRSDVIYANQSREPNVALGGHLSQARNGPSVALGCGLLFATGDFEVGERRDKDVARRLDKKRNKCPGEGFRWCQQSMTDGLARSDARPLRVRRVTRFARYHRGVARRRLSGS